MGINIILPLIMGIAMTVIVGSQVAPSFVEQMKVAKVENRTISNQNLIKDAIVRYIKMTGLLPDPKNPKGPLADLNDSGLLKDYHESNIFGGGYSFYIDPVKGTLTIFTTINDENAGKYFSNSFKFPNAPTCKQALDSNGVCVSGEFETFYLLDEDTFPIPTPPPPAEVGSIQDILDRFTEDNIGKKKDKDGKEIVFNVNDKDNFLKDNKNGTFTITEKVKNSDGTWSNTGKETIISGNNIGKETGVLVNNNLVDCDKATTPPASEQEVFVVNKDTSLGEIIWVAPDSVSAIQTKIFTNNYTPNNICTSKVTTMKEMFLSKSFNKRLNRWDTRNVEDMYRMFSSAISFDQAIGSWNTSKVTNMGEMFQSATSFNQPIGSWNTSNVTNMIGVFNSATSFNQNISNWDTSKVIIYTNFAINSALTSGNKPPKFR